MKSTIAFAAATFVIGVNIGTLTQLSVTKRLEDRYVAQTKRVDECLTGWEKALEVIKTLESVCDQNKQTIQSLMDDQNSLPEKSTIPR